MINLFLDRPDVEISAIYDIDDKMIEMTKEIFRKKGRPIPKIYNRDENDYLNLLSIVFDNLIYSHPLYNQVHILIMIVLNYFV